MNMNASVVSAPLMGLVAAFAVCVATEAPSEEGSPVAGNAIYELTLTAKRQHAFVAPMKTTVVLPDAIFRRAKAETAMQGRTLRAFFLDAVVHELEGNASRTSNRRRAKLPLVRSRHPGSLQITGDVIAKALLEDDVHAST